MDALALVLRGVRNGAYYGTKIRAPHAAVMTVLFRDGTLLQKLGVVAQLTFEHTVNLASFVGVYKLILALGRWANGALSIPVSTSAGMPANGLHAFLAGCIGGYLIWGAQTPVNYQIILYLLSRVVVSIVKVLAARKLAPFSLVSEAQAFPVFAAVVWGLVMYLFEQHQRQVNPSLASSMRFLYHESNSWKTVQDFLPSAATTFFVLYHLYARYTGTGALPRKK